jgi:signal transduction histidine kinase
MKRDILYVDDEMDNLIVFEATFEDNFNVVTANSGQQALETLERQSFPVVVADQRMPFMTGAELFEQMRFRYPHTKRVMLTGYADSHAMLDAINQGQVYYFIKKPWDRDLVFSILVRAIESYDLSLSNMALTDRLVANDRCATLGRSAARIAHEMGNQLCMLPLLELIEEKYRDHEDLIKMASIARTTHDRLLELVNEVKSFVRFNHEDQVRQPLQLSDLVHELVEFLRFDRTLPMDCLSVQLVADATVRGNKVNLQQVLVNLLKNAAHAIRDRFDGHIELIVSSKDSHAELIVADNGHGMTAEVQQRIWETFFTTKGTEGTGLGLDIVKSIVEAHSGRITCHSAPNAGAKFTITLPLADAARPAQAGVDQSRILEPACA